MRNPLLLGGLALAGCAYLAVVDPNRTTATPLCPFRLVTGHDCVGCGATRAVRALLEGDVVRALDHNVLFTLAVPVLVYAWVVWLAGALGHRLPWLRLRPWIVWASAAVMMAFWAARLVLGPDAWISSGAV